MSQHHAIGPVGLKRTYTVTTIGYRETNKRESAKAFRDAFKLSQLMHTEGWEQAYTVQGDGSFVTLWFRTDGKG